MNILPDPLHAAVVHFPIVLILVGAAAAVAAVVWRRGHLPQYAAGLLALGALGAGVAVETGEDDGSLLASGSTQMESLLDAHQAWAERTLTVAVIAAGLALAAVAVARWPRVRHGVAAATAIAAVAAGWSVYQTGHRGGALVYRHGAGVTLAPVTGPAGAPAVGPAKERDRD